MLNNNGLLSGVFKLAGTGSPSNSKTPVSNQLVASYGNIALTGSTNPQTMVIIPNYKGMPMSSFKISLSVTDTTGATVPSGVFSIENVIQSIKLQTKDGKNIFDFNGSLLDISTTARYLNPAGLVNNSPTPADSTASTAYTETWDIIIPFGVAAKFFNCKLFVTFNTLASRATTGNSMTSTINYLRIYANYHDVAVVDQQIINQTIPISGTGSINLQPNLIDTRTYYMQAYQYGGVESSSATDSVIGSTGNGITFTPDGNLYYQNSPLQTFIDKENTQYPNTISIGVGHETGLINLFTDPFVAGASTEFTIDFTGTPSTGGSSGQSGQIRSIWVVNLQ